MTDTIALRDRVQAVSRLAYVTVERGVLPFWVSSLGVLVREGREDIHWKVLGDALARVLEGWGPLATKLGQVLAFRTDVLPEPVCGRLEVLLARQRPMHPRELERALERAYPKGTPFELDARPLGTGSVGQVHRAVLSTGEKVVVKVLRPGVAQAIERDVKSARALLPLVARLFKADPAGERLLARALEDVAQGLRRETDLLAEADALVDFRARVASRNPRVVVPLCHRELSRPDVLVMEALEGESLATFRKRAKDDPEAAKRIAALAFTEILEQVFEDGRFHADPHAGNLLVLPDGRLGLVDLGLTGRFGANERRAVTQAVRAFAGRDPENVIRALLGLGAPPPGFRLEAFQKDVLQVVKSRPEPTPASPSGEEPTRLERLVNDLLAVARRHEIEIPPSTTLLVKTLVTIEGVARSLDPDLDVTRAALPVVVRALRPRWLGKLAFWRTKPAASS
jgi:ubiquinone biosynthesis protein